MYRTPYSKMGSGSNHSQRVTLVQTKIQRRKKVVADMKVNHIICEHIVQIRHVWKPLIPNFSALGTTFPRYTYLTTLYRIYYSQVLYRMTVWRRTAFNIFLTDDNFTEHGNYMSRETCIGIFSYILSRTIGNACVNEWWQY